jgi:hypothetical protein
MKARKNKTTTIKKKEENHVEGYSFKAPPELVNKANKKYFDTYQKVSLSALVNILLNEYVSK